MPDLSGKTALVTGGSRGIGKQIALQLAEAGASVVVNYVSDAAAATRTVDAIVASGSKAVAVQADVSQRADITKLFDEAEANFGTLDIVIANAARYTKGAIIDTTEEDFDRVFSLNARGTFFCLQEAGRRIVDGGCIVVISASGVGGSSPNQSVYHATKTIEDHLVRVLAREIGHRSVRVNSLAPGPTRTEMFEDAPQEVLDDSASRTDLGRVGETKDIADVVLFLASDEARWVTGQNLRANGGFHPF